VRAVLKFIFVCKLELGINASQRLQTCNILVCVCHHKAEPFFHLRQKDFSYNRTLDIIVSYYVWFEVYVPTLDEHILKAPRIALVVPTWIFPALGLAQLKQKDCMTISPTGSEKKKSYFWIRLRLMME